MPFRPINSDHSVSAASFQLQFATMIPANVVAAVKANADLWQKHLPAVSLGQVMQFQVAPDGIGASAVRPGEGIEFSFMRPDGTPAWVMRVQGNAVAVECSRYTRWHSVFAQASGYLRDFLRVAADVDPSLGVTNIVLVVVDDFLWFGESDRKDYDLRKLLAPGPRLAEIAFSVGAVFHSNIGWFEADEQFGGDVLQILNVASSHSDPLCVANNAQAHINIQQVQDYRRPWTIGQLSSEFDTTFTGLFEKMHIRNKSVLQEILVTDAAKEIGLS